MTGIALLMSDLPVTLVREFGLSSRLHEQPGQPEYQFHWWQDPTVLPVQWEGSFRILRWGCKDRRSPLPYGGWIDREHVEAGHLGHARPEEVVIPGRALLCKGVWHPLTEGIRGVVLSGARGGPVVYMLIEPATNYWRNMTEQTPMMPVLINQVI